MSGEQKNVICKNINWQWFPRLAHAWDVLWYDIVSVDQIAHGKCDCRTVILAIIFYRSLVSESSVTGLGVYTRRWVYDNITPHSLCHLARVRPVCESTIRLCGWESDQTFDVSSKPGYHLLLEHKINMLITKACTNVFCHLHDIWEAENYEPRSHAHDYTRICHKRDPLKNSLVNGLPENLAL